MTFKTRLLDSLRKISASDSDLTEQEAADIHNDHAQLDEVLVRVPAARSAPLGVGERRPDEVGAGPVVELAVGDADDVGGLSAAEALCAHGARPS